MVHGKTALVSGSTRGTELGIAAACGRRHQCHPQRLRRRCGNRGASRCPGHGVEVRYDGVDLMRQDQIERMMAKALGSTEVQVINAGLLAAQPVAVFASLLASDAAATITGAILPIEGGWTAPEALFAPIRRSSWEKTIMAANRMQNSRHGNGAAKQPPDLPGQVVLVLQGGGALGAYQVGVYQALHEAGIEPDWVIGTSIGAINGALIAGNATERRLKRLHEFWHRVEQRAGASVFAGVPALGTVLAYMTTMTNGLAPFFSPNPMSWFGPHLQVGLEDAAYYTTTPLRATLTELVDLDYLNDSDVRLTVGAVHVSDGEMRYFDSRDEPLRLEHVMASGALPPVFPAVRIDGEPYWDGGIYSNTPIEAVLDDKPRRDSVIFTVHMWHPEGPEPKSLWEVMGRQKDIQYASRAKSHIARQKQIHHLRHIIRELAKHIPEQSRNSTEVKELASWGCGSTMHVARLIAPRLDGEDQFKDIDFTPAGIEARWKAGYTETRRMLALAPWQRPVDPMEGVVIHEAAVAESALAHGVDGFDGRTK